MFEIKYRIVVDTKELLLLTPEMFDNEFSDFEGIIELNFNGNKIGYIYEEEISEDMFRAGCFQNEWLLFWFTNLLKAVKLLRENNYLILSEIESPNWLEFTKLNDNIKVKEFREMPHIIKNFEASHLPMMSVSPLNETIWLNNGETYSKSVEMETTDFVESYISYVEFEQVVKRKSNDLLNEVWRTFPNLINSKSVKEFEEIIYSIDD